MTNIYYLKEDEFDSFLFYISDNGLYIITSDDITRVTERPDGTFINDIYSDPYAESRGYHKIYSKNKIDGEYQKEWFNEFKDNEELKRYLFDILANAARIVKHKTVRLNFRDVLATRLYMELLSIHRIDE